MLLYTAALLAPYFFIVSVIHGILLKSLMLILLTNPHSKILQHRNIYMAILGIWILSLVIGGESFALRFVVKNENAAYTFNMCTLVWPGINIVLWIYMLTVVRGKSSSHGNIVQMTFAVVLVQLVTFIQNTILIITITDPATNRITSAISQGHSFVLSKAFKGVHGGPNLG